MSLGLQSYQERLEVFLRTCDRLVDQGLAYVCVALCHELVRHLYPHEPVLGLTPEHPVAAIHEHLERLIGAGERMLEALRGYPAPAPAPAPGEQAAGQEGSVALRTSSLYTSMWETFDRDTLERESLTLLRRRIPERVIASSVSGRRVLDMGCGSGRYTLALGALGADVTGIDVQARAYRAAEAIAREKGIRASFVEGNVLALPFAPAAFDFVFCNGVLHHTTDLPQGLDELGRVLGPHGSAFLYLYGAGGIFWHSRARLRELFRRIPYAHTVAAFDLMGVPKNRFVFCDTWYVPIERHTTRREIETWLRQRDFRFEKLISENLIDLDNAIARGVEGAEVMWGDGDHRYLLEKP